MTERDWKNLLGNLQSGNCVLFVGPGIRPQHPPDHSSDSSHTPTPLAGLAGHLSTALATHGHAARGCIAASLAQAFERIEGLGGRNALIEEVQTFCAASQTGPSTLERALATAPFSLILTTLIDEGLATAFTETAGKTPHSSRYRSRNYGELEPLPTWSAREPLIYHLHGRLSEGDPVVLTESDHIAALKAIVTDQPPLPKAIVAHLRQEETAFLFLGFGLRHPYLKFFLSHFRAARRNDSYALEPTVGGVARDEDAVIFYNGDRVGFRDISLDDFIPELARRTTSLQPVPKKASSGVRPRVFISYASPDRRFAKRLHDDLDARGFDVWLDKVRLQGGDRWDADIATEIARSDYVVVLQSQALARRIDSYVNKEIELAIDRGKRLRRKIGHEQTLRCVIPLQIETCQLLEDLLEFHTEPLGMHDYPSELDALVGLLRRDEQLRRRAEQQ